MKIRRRLYPEEARFLGIEVKKAEPYDLKSQPRYTIDKSDWKKIKNKRTKMRKEKEEVKQAKILIFDIEVSPTKAWVWSKFQNMVGDEMVENEWWMITWSAKWLFGDEIFSGKVTAEEALNNDDSRITKSLWRLIDEADILVGHNIQKFDRKKMNTRFLMHGLPAPSSYLMIDTLLHARKQFAFHSNKLDYIAQKLGVGKKVKHEGFEMWKKCMKGDTEAINKMQEYNDGDILINEEVYIKIRGYVKPHPNLNLFIEEDSHSCPTCGSDKLKYNGEYTTYANTYTEYQCKRCGNSCRANKKHTKLTPLPR